MSTQNELRDPLPRCRQSFRDWPPGQSRGLGEFGVDEIIITDHLLQQCPRLDIRLPTEGSDHVWLAKRHIVQDRPHCLALALMDVVLHLSWILVLSLDLVILQLPTAHEATGINSSGDPMLIVLPTH